MTDDLSFALFDEKAEFRKLNSDVLLIDDGRSYYETLTDHYQAAFGKLVLKSRIRTRGDDSHILIGSKRFETEADVVMFKMMHGDRLRMTRLVAA